MYRDFTPLVLVSFLSIGELFFGCSPSQESSTNSATSDEPQPLEKKSGRHSLRGLCPLSIHCVKLRNFVSNVPQLVKPNGS